ncbi:MAG: hypothetical protein ABR969_08845 [Sedimentisphaerales bacterium]
MKLIGEAEVKNMKKSNLFYRIILIVLVMTNIGTIIYGSWRELQWRYEMIGEAAYAGSLQAKVDYDHGQLKVFELVCDDKNHFSGKKDQFSGKKDGQFEVWYKNYYSFLGWPHKYGEGLFVKAYNASMQNQYKCSQKNEQKKTQDVNLGPSDKLE